MNSFFTRLLAVCFFLTVVCPIIGAAADDNNTSYNNTSIANLVEIRSPVYNGSTLIEILANPAYGNGSNITMDATQFATLYYDIDQNLTTETLTLK